MEITHELYPVALANLISTISMHIIKFGENPLRFTQSYCPETKLWTCRGQIILSKIRPLAIPNQIYTISMHIPSLVKIDIYSSSSGNEHTDEWSTTDGRMGGHTDRHTGDQRETIIPRHYRVAGYKKVTKLWFQRNEQLIPSEFHPKSGMSPCVVDFGLGLILHFHMRFP